ncbi:MAG: hypothetical protein R2726_20385 [Acidimicrobiales bacterium]
MTLDGRARGERRRGGDHRPGTLHTLVNVGDEPAQCEAEYRPAGRSLAWFQLLGAHQQRTGREPGALDLGPFLPDVGLYLAAPIPVQRLAYRFVLKPLGIALGRRRRMLDQARAVHGPDFQW